MVMQNILKSSMVMEEYYLKFKKRFTVNNIIVFGEMP